MYHYKHVSISRIFGKCQELEKNYCVLCPPPVWFFAHIVHDGYLRRLFILELQTSNQVYSAHKGHVWDTFCAVCAYYTPLVNTVGLTECTNYPPFSILLVLANIEIQPQVR